MRANGRPIEAVRLVLFAQTSTSIFSYWAKEADKQEKAGIPGQRMGVELSFTPHDRS